MKYFLSLTILILVISCRSSKSVMQSSSTEQASIEIKQEHLVEASNLEIEWVIDSVFCLPPYLQPPSIEISDTEKGIQAKTETAPRRKTEYIPIKGKISISKSSTTQKAVLDSTHLKQNVINETKKEQSNEKSKIPWRSYIFVFLICVCVNIIYYSVKFWVNRKKSL